MSPIKMLPRLAPSEYSGLPLCPACGDDGTGHAYELCTGKYSHAEACATYTWADDVCADCEIWLREQEPPVASSGGDDG